MGTPKDRVVAGGTQRLSSGCSSPICVLSVPPPSSHDCSVPTPSAPCPSDSIVPAGRGLKSHAYIHSVQLSHHVFLNLHTLKFYCLPDNYEIIDSSLEDITVRGAFRGTPALGGHVWGPQFWGGWVWIPSSSEEFGLGSTQLWVLQVGIIWL